MREVTIETRSAKIDEGGEGHRFTSVRVDPQSTPDRPFDRAEQLWDFACVSRPVRGMAFLTWQGKWRLTYGKFNAKIKEVARGEYGDDSGFATHSIRIAGASALANAGVPDHIIAPMHGQMEVAGLPGIYTIVNGSVQRGSKRVMQPEVTDNARREKDDARSKVRVARLAAETGQS